MNRDTRIYSRTVISPANRDHEGRDEHPLAEGVDSGRRGAVALEKQSGKPRGEASPIQAGVQRLLTELPAWLVRPGQLLTIGVNLTEYVCEARRLTSLQTLHGAPAAPQPHANR